MDTTTRRVRALVLKRWEHVAGEPETLTIHAGKERIVVEGLQKVREGALTQPKTAAQIAEAAAAQAAQQAEAKHGKE